MVNKFNVDPSIAGVIPGILPLSTILLTPIFGNIYDKLKRSYYNGNRSFFYFRPLNIFYSWFT